MHTVFKNKRLLFVSLFFSTVAATSALAEPPTFASCMQTQCDPARIFSWPTVIQTLQSCMDTEICATSTDPNAILNSMRCSEVLNNNLATCQILVANQQSQSSALQFSTSSGINPSFNNFPNSNAPTFAPPITPPQTPPPSPPPPAFEQTKPQGLPLSPGPVIPNGNNTKRTFNWF